MSGSDSQATIRQANEGDSETIAQHNLRMAKESEGLDLDIATLRAGAHNLLIDSSKGTYYIAEIHNQLVGQLMITYEWSDWRNAQMWWIQSVYVCPEVRRRGLFKQLYEYVRRESISAKAGGLRLYVDKNNTRAQATVSLLQSQGY